MKTVDILGENRFENYTKTRDGSRAIIIKDGKILLTHELNSDKPGSRCRSGRVRSRTAYGIVSFLRNINDVEVCCLLERLRSAKEYIEITIDAEDYYRIKESEKKSG